MVLREVIEPSAMIDLDSSPILLIDDVFCDVHKVLFCVLDYLLKAVILAVYIIYLINQAFSIDNFQLRHYFGYLLRH